MAAEESQDNDKMEQVAEIAPSTSGAGIEGPAGKKRPRIDLSIDHRERKRGKSMFGILVGTLNKAKKEDQDRNTSEAAKKRAEIDRRLQAQRAEETDHVRRLEEIKRDRQTANRKEEELKLRQTIYQCRRTRLPSLTNYLLTSDEVPVDDSEMSTPSLNPLAPPPRTHPPPLYYLPAVLLPAQNAFLEKRNKEVNEAIEKEWLEWLEFRKEGYEEIDKLRARIEEEEKREQETQSKDESNLQNPMEETKSPLDKNIKMDEIADNLAANGDKEQTKEDRPAKEPEKEKESAKEGDAVMAVDGDDAVEY